MPPTWTYAGSRESARSWLETNLGRAYGPDWDIAEYSMFWAKGPVETARGIKQLEEFETDVERFNLALSNLQRSMNSFFPGWESRFWRAHASPDIAGVGQNELTDGAMANRDLDNRRADVAASFQNIVMATTKFNGVRWKSEQARANLNATKRKRGESISSEKKAANRKGVGDFLRSFGAREPFAPVLLAMAAVYLRAEKPCATPEEWRTMYKRWT